MNSSCQCFPSSSSGLSGVLASSLLLMQQFCLQEALILVCVCFGFVLDFFTPVSFVDCGSQMIPFS